MAEHGASDFGKDFGLIHEAVVTGRKVGADRDLWARLAHDEVFFARVVAMHHGEGGSDQLPDIDWAKVYAALGMSAEYEAQNSLDMTQPGSWIVPVLRDVTANKLVAALRGLGVAVYTYVNDLDGNVPTNLRDPKNGPYAVRFKKTVEADPEFANLSANDCKQKKISSITLIERLLLEVGYFMTTGKHLDEKNVTLCAGSRRSGGSVPGVCWHPHDREVCVDWYLPDGRCGGLRSRAAV